jgi:hypothetical protein
MARRASGAPTRYTTRRRAAHGGRPGGAAVAVGQHLDFIDHGHVDRGLRIQHFHRAGHVGGARHQPALFARDQADLERLAVLLHLLQALVVFQRQQAQRRQIDAAWRLAQRFHRLVGLAGIGRPQHGDELALDAARHLERGRILGQVDALARALGVLFLHVALDRVLQALADAVEHLSGRLGNLHVAERVEEGRHPCRNRRRHRPVPARRR